MFVPIASMGAVSDRASFSRWFSVAICTLDERGLFILIASNPTSRLPRFVGRGSLNFTIGRVPSMALARSLAQLCLGRPGKLVRGLYRSGFA